MQPSGDVRQMLALIADRYKRGQAARKAGESEVGVFFVYDGHVLLSGTPISVAEPHGNFKRDAYSHHTFWKNLQRNGMVPRDGKYNEVRRGRVEYNLNEKKFYVYADPCILNDREVLNEIHREFHLPSTNTEGPERNPHYRCPGCIRPKVTKEQEEGEWEM